MEEHRERPLGPLWGTQVMRQDEPGHGEPIGPRDWLKIVPFEAAASSDRLGVGGPASGTLP